VHADLVLTGGVVRAVAGPYAGHAGHAGAAEPLPSTLAVREGRIFAIGTEDEIREYIRPATDVIDLAGGSVLPGFQDAHAHPVSGGLERMRCDLTGCRTEPDCLAAIAVYVAAHPEREWVTGGGWAMEAFPGGCPTAVALDAVVSDRPAFLPNRDHHSGWANSRALALAGITRDTPHPADGRIERDADGNPTGALHEGAMDLVEKLLPTATADDLHAGLLVGQAYLHALGITGWQDAWVGEGAGVGDTLPTYLDAAASGELTARVVGALWWDRSRGLDQIEDLIERRARGPVGRFRPATVKIMLDGVCETFTAAMLSPYLDGHGHETANRGLGFIDPDLLSEIVTRLDAAGFQVHMHALGDRGVREALDAVAAARSANPDRDLRHQIAHIQVVQPADVSRFGALNATANIQPLWACADRQMTELTIPFLGADRSTWQYPFASIAAAGGRLAIGSDWPVTSPDPLEIMHVAVHRTEPGAGPGAEPFLPAERLSLADAVYAYTMGSAHANHQDDDTGSLEVGKHADLVVLDRDLFAPDAGPITDASVRYTLVEGTIVHAA
jgi:predicted amidohydrolase YtcJ